MAIIRLIRQKIAKEEYEFTIPHFLEEMANDDLIVEDIEFAIAKGRIRRRFSQDPRGIRFEVVGPALDGREIAVVCRVKNSGNLLLITTYALEQK